MRIAIFSNAYKPAISGVVTSIARFKKGLQSLGHQVHIFAPEYENFVDSEPYIFRFPALDLSEQLNVSVVVPIRNLMWPSVRAIKPALIHSQHPILMGDIAASFASELDIPLVFTFHTQYEKYAQFYSPIAGRLAGRITEEVVDRYLAQCDHVIVPTESIREMLVDEFGLTDRVSVVPTPVDLQAFEDLQASTIKEQYAPNGEKLLLYVGRMAREKGLTLLLESYKDICRLRQDTKLLMVGTGPQLGELKRNALRAGVQDKVIFIGAVAPDEVPAYYLAADLFVFTSSSETQGLVLIEAMAAGTPIVAVQAPGSHDVLARGGGCLVPSSREAFSAAVIRLLEGHIERERMGDAGRREAERYSVKKSTETLLAAYAKALAWKDQNPPGA
jgi:glycosyltransferase involved in cell wall biosynthesis